MLKHWQISSLTPFHTECDTGNAADGKPRGYYFLELFFNDAVHNMVHIIHTIQCKTELIKIPVLTTTHHRRHLPINVTEVQCSRATFVYVFLADILSTLPLWVNNTWWSGSYDKNECQRVQALTVCLVRREICWPWQYWVWVCEEHHNQINVCSTETK